MNEVLLVAGMAAVTFAVRYPVLALVGKIELPRRIFRALAYVPPAILAAIIVPAVLMPQGNTLDIAPGNPRLIASVIAVLAIWRTRNLLLTFLIGMGVFLLLRVRF